jgi:hypothetical protein
MPRQSSLPTLEAEGIVLAVHALLYAGPAGALVGLLLAAIITLANAWSLSSLIAGGFGMLAMILLVFLWQSHNGVSLRRDIWQAEAGISVVGRDPDGPGPAPRHIEWAWQDQAGRNRFLALPEVPEADLLPLARASLLLAGSLAEESMLSRIPYGWRKFRKYLDVLANRKLAEKTPDGWKLTDLGNDLFRAFVADAEEPPE